MSIHFRNQVEISPWLQRNALRAAIKEVGAVPMAYSPLARGHKVDDPGICEIAESVGCTPAQAAIKWCLDVGAITMGFLYAVLTISLMVKTSSLSPLILFLVYFLDSSWTIVERWIAKENIFLPHRKHLYQLLVKQL